MLPRIDYEMTEEDLEELLGLCKPVPYMVVGGSPPPSQQANANAAWEKLGKKMGFVSSSVLPIDGKGLKYFSAVPRENDEQRKERELIEKQSRITNELEELDRELETINVKIKEKKTELDEFE